MKEKYEINGNNLEIIDPELKINLVSDLQIEKKTTYYDNKKILSVMHYHNDLLHGPSIFYSKDGTILSSSWFFNGKRYGKAYQYYKSSNLYAFNQYIADNYEDKQTYYFENGSIKTIMNYKNGRLHGEVKLFYENSKMKRQLIFDNGQKIQDKIFDVNEKIINEESFSL